MFYITTVSVTKTKYVPGKKAIYTPGIYKYQNLGTCSCANSQWRNMNKFVPSRNTTKINL